jgi:TolB-like protein
MIGLVNEVAAEKSQESEQGRTPFTLAVLPAHNLSATPIPSDTIKKSLIDNLSKRGLQVVTEENLRQFIFKYRMRYVGGITRETAEALKQETGVDGVLITTVGFYNDTPPPKIAIFSRLVSTGPSPEILWMDGVGSAGNDTLGLFELNLIEDPRVLLIKALDYLTTSLVNGLENWGENRKIHPARQKFQPKFVYRSPQLDSKKKYKIAVVPFLNRGERKHAGEILSLHFINRLVKTANFTVIEPGVVRHTLLRTRIIMEDGVSLPDARAVFARANAQLVLGGKVFDYQDFPGETGKARVDFSAALIDRASLEVVWACKSDNAGDEGVWFFGLGQVNTAHALAAEMVAIAVDTIRE